MKLNEIEVTNFRGFDHLELKFDDRVTVIAGINGIGKSTIMHALAIALSHALPEFTSSQEKLLPISKDDVMHGKTTCIINIDLTELEGAVFLATIQKESLDDSVTIELEKKRAYLSKELTLEEKGTPTYKNKKNELAWLNKRLDGTATEKSFRWLFTDVHESESRLKRHLKTSPKQPIAVYYSTKRLLSRLPPTLKGSIPLKQSAAHSKSLAQLEISLNDFAQWHKAIFSSKILRKDTLYGKKLMAHIENAVSHFIPDITSIWLIEKNPPRYLATKRGQEFFLEQLSDGERGLLAIVFDLTRRLAIANPLSDNPIAEGVAIVLIDEIELHLHPKWQREVLKKLKDTFRSCQFIVTTHSPMVLGEVEAKCVRFLEIRDGKVNIATPPEAYGMDANRILQELMDAPIRNIEIEKKLHELFLLIDEEQFDKASAAIIKLENKLGADEPELTRAKSLIHFLDGIQ